MYKVSFVILHYLTTDLTIKCVNSICKNIDYNYSIIIVDNFSPNGSGKILKDLYYSNKKIIVLLVEENKGFSAGNNIGYQFAKNEIGADFIIMINNDTEIIQNNFILKTFELYEKHQYYVLGPDIINLEGQHQSPQREHVITKKEAYFWLIKRIIWTWYLIFEKTFFTSSYESLIMKRYINRQKTRKNNFKYAVMQMNVELQGACLIFSPLYLAKSQFAFLEKTFMYGEEAMLAYQCKRKNRKILYSPEIKIRHLERGSTTIGYENIDKEIIYSKRHVKAIYELLKLMNEK